MAAPSSSGWMSSHHFFFQDKIKLEKVKGQSGSSSGGGHHHQELDQKKVTVQVGDRYKGTGQSSRRRMPAANLDITRWAEQSFFSFLSASLYN